MYKKFKMYLRIDFETYNTLDKIMGYIDSVANSTNKYTDKKVNASITNLETTYEGQTIKMLKLAVQVRQITCFS